MTSVSTIVRKFGLTAAFTLCLGIVSAVFAPVSYAASSKAPVAEKSVYQKVEAKINVNTASVEQLATLKGVGEKKAKAIIDYRNAHGKFRSVEQLTEVKGLGAAFLKHNQSRIML